MSVIATGMVVAAAGVTKIQFLLNQSGFHVKVDGIFGSATTKAALEFR